MSLAFTLIFVVVSGEGHGDGEVAIIIEVDVDEVVFKSSRCVIDGKKGSFGRNKNPAVSRWIIFLVLL